MKPEKRAIVISDLGGGGTQRVVLSLVSDWLKLGHEVILISLSDESSDCYEVPRGTIRIPLGCTETSNGPISGLINNIRRVYLIRKAIGQSGATQVISFLAATNILTILATCGQSVRLVISERNDPARQFLGRVWNQLRRHLYKHADVITANSHQAISTLSSFVSERKLVYVPNPLPDWFSEVPAFSIEEREPIVLSVGRLHEQKGHDNLLRIFAASKARQAGWKLVILGDGGQRRALEDLADNLGIKEDVSMPGFQKDVKSWYSRAGIFALMSRYEGTSNAMIEAIAMGLPIIVNITCGDAAHYVDRLKCGIVVDTACLEHCTQSLDMLAADASLRQSMTQNGHAGLMQFFSPQTIQKKWEQAILGSIQ